MARTAWLAPHTAPSLTQTAAALAVGLQDPALIAGALHAELVLVTFLAALEVLGTVALDLAGVVVRAQLHAQWARAHDAFTGSHRAVVTTAAVIQRALVCRDKQGTGPGSRSGRRQDMAVSHPKPWRPNPQPPRSLCLGGTRGTREPDTWDRHPLPPTPLSTLHVPVTLLGPQLGPGHFAFSLGEPFGQGPFFDLSLLRCNLGEGAEGNALTPLTGSGTCCLAATTSAVSGPILDGFSLHTSCSQKSRDSTQTFTSPRVVLADPDPVPSPSFCTFCSFLGTQINSLPPEVCSTLCLTSSLLLLFSSD